MNSIIAEKIQDFFDTGVPEVFERDLDLGAVQPPARGNLAIGRGRSPLRKDISSLSGNASHCSGGIQFRQYPLLQL